MRHFITSRLWSSRTFTLSSTLAASALFSAALLGIMETPTVSATTARRATIQSLTEQAELIVYAKVGERWTPKARGPRGQIYTYTELNALEVWRGEASTSLLLVQLGGQLDDLRLRVEGDAELKSGQEVVLFLTRAPNDAPPVVDERASSGGAHAVNLVSLAQGAFYLERDPADASPLASPQTPLRQDLDGIVFYRAAPSEVKLSADTPSLAARTTNAPSPVTLAEVNPAVERAWTLASLKSRVKQLSVSGAAEGGAR